MNNNTNIIGQGIRKLDDAFLPKGWESSTLEKRATIIQGGRLGLTKEKNYGTSGVPAYSAAGQDGFVEKTEFESDGVILSAIGAQCGKCFYATGKWTTLANTQVIIPNSDLLNAKLLFYRVNFPNYWPISGSAQPFIKPSDIKKCWIAYPIEILEQQKIAEILSTIDELIDQTAKVIAKLKRIKSGLMNDLLTKGIDNEGKIRNEETHKFKNSSLGRIPKDWQVATLSQISTLDRGKFTHRPRNDPRFYGGKYPFIQTGDVTNSNGRIVKHTQTLNEHGLRVSKLFPKGTIIVTIAANIGDTAIANYKVAFPDSLVGIVVHPGTNYEYVEYALRTRRSDLNVISTQSAQKNINLQILNPLQIKLPGTEKEQTLIASMLNTSQQNINTEKQYQNKLQRIKAGLMDDLLSGKVRVNHLIRKN